MKNIINYLDDYLNDDSLYESFTKKNNNKHNKKKCKDELTFESKEKTKLKHKKHITK